jgi:hypothetical protein
MDIRTLTDWQLHDKFFPLARDMNDLIEADFPVDFASTTEGSDCIIIRVIGDMIEAIAPFGGTFFNSIDVDKCKSIVEEYINSREAKNNLLLYDVINKCIVYDYTTRDILVPIGRYPRKSLNSAVCFDNSRSLVFRANVSRGLVSVIFLAEMTRNFLAVSLPQMPASEVLVKVLASNMALPEIAPNHFGRNLTFVVNPEATLLRFPDSSLVSLKKFAKKTTARFVDKGILSGDTSEIIVTDGTYRVTDILNEEIPDISYTVLEDDLGLGEEGIDIIYIDHGQLVVKLLPGIDMTSVEAGKMLGVSTTSIVVVKG